MTTQLHENLLPQIAKGDETAVASCIERYGSLVWSISRKMINEHAAAEDVTQEVFIDLWKSAKRYDPALAKETTFVSMIARRRCLDYLRKKKELLQDAEALDKVIEQTPEDQLVQDEEAVQIRKWIKELDPPKGEAIELHICEGLPHQEVAKRLSLPLGTVKTHIRRGLQTIRQRMGFGQEVVKK